MHVPGEHLPFSDSTLRECDLLGVDLEALIDRYFEVEGKKAAKGKRIADRSSTSLSVRVPRLAIRSCQAMIGVPSALFRRAIVHKLRSGTSPMFSSIFQRHTNWTRI